MKAKGFDTKNEDVDCQIGEIVEEHFSNLAKTAKIDIEERLIQPFEEALSSLSQISPVLAYKLRGKEKLELIAKLNSSYLNNLRKEVINNVDEEWTKNTLLEFSTEVENQALCKMTRNLDEEIVLLSKHCGWIEYYRCRGVLSFRFGEFDKEEFLELDKLIDKLVVKLAAANNVLHSDPLTQPSLAGDAPNQSLCQGARELER